MSDGHREPGRPEAWLRTPGPLPRPSGSFSTQAGVMWGTLTCNGKNFKSH